MKEKKKRSKLFYLNLIWLVLWPISIWLYADFREQKHKENPERTMTVRQEKGYKLISPLLECNLQEQDEIQKYIPFENKLKQKIQDEIIDQNPNIKNSIYFRNLRNGPWIGINEEEDFHPASLLKVPIMIAWLKEMEKDPRLAEKEFNYEKSEKSYSITQYVVPESRMEEGKKYTVNELMRRMIVGSDNDSMYILEKNIPSDKIAEVYDDLGVDYSEMNKKDDFMSVKEYASFFRILYNAAYLNRESSEKALELLSQSEFKKGIVEGIDDDFVVAHKFGEFNLIQGNKEIKQLHDCGIVYYPKYPYLLCVMTRGGDYDELSRTIAKIAKTIHGEIRRSYP